MNRANDPNGWRTVYFVESARAAPRRSIDVIVFRFFIGFLPTYLLASAVVDALIGAL